jgi:hypothetical protein
MRHPCGTASRKEINRSGIPFFSIKEKTTWHTKLHSMYPEAPASTNARNPHSCEGLLAAPVSVGSIAFCISACARPCGTLRVVLC